MAQSRYLLRPEKIPDNHSPSNNRQYPKKQEKVEQSGPPNVEITWKLYD
jgi:hypothetical protein